MNEYMINKNELNNVIAENVTRLMNQQQISGLKLSKRCGISPASIGRIASGSIGVSVEMCLKLAYGLEVDVSEILSGIPNFDANAFSNMDTTGSKDLAISIGILSLKERRVTCIKDSQGKILGESELHGGLDLAEPASFLLSAIQESILEANAGKLPINALKSAHLKLVTQSYEFEGVRQKFIQFMGRHYKSTLILPDWKITHLADFIDYEGISLVVEKGVSLSFKHNGHLKKIGGWKFPVYDLGGENWLGMKAIHHAIEAKEQFVPMTPLAETILDKHNGKIERITEFCFKGADTDVYSLFCEPLKLHYFRGEKTALSIIQEGFSHIQKSIQLSDSLIGKQLPISLNGSIADLYKDFLDKHRLCKTTSVQEKARLLTDIVDEQI